MTHAPPALPKPGSAPLKELWESLKRVLDAPRTILVLEGALDRRSLEEILQKVMKGGASRPGQMPRPELVGRLADGFHRHVDVAFALMKELDKSCTKERHIVASIDEAHIEERLTTYRALDFRRERARLVWALVRDGRPAHEKAADRVLTEAFAAAQTAADAHAEAAAAPAPGQGVDAGGSGGGGVVEAQLATYEKAIVEQQRALAAATGLKESAERERGELLIKIGQRERALREEEELRRGVETERDKLRAEIDGLRAALEQSRPEALSSTQKELERLQEKNRALEARAERAERLAELEQKLEEQRRVHDDDRRQWQSAREDLEEQLRAMAEKEAAAQERAQALREELKAARRQLAGEDAGEAPEPGRERVGVFVDAANLSASARRDFGKKLDYRSLLEELLASRKRAAAVCFVVRPVDDGEQSREQHAGFVRSLREGGYDVREKRPKARSDGTHKADWDMGIAMEILDRLDDLDVVVLCSGDGDFLPLVSRLKREKKRVEVAAFRAFTDEALVKAAHAFTALDGRFRMPT